MNDKERAEQELNAKGFPEGTSAPIDHATLKQWIMWGMAEGRRAALADERARIVDLKGRIKKGDPAIECTVCDQKIRKLNPHSMDRTKVDLLMTIARMNANGIEWVKIQQDSSLIPAAERHRTLQRDAVHASRLTWFGLLVRMEDRSGEFRVSQSGVDFLLGKSTVPERIWCQGGRVIRKSDNEVTVHQIKDVVYDKAYWDQYPRVQTY